MDNKQLMGAGSLVCLLVSLPLTWLTLHNPEVRSSLSGFPEILRPTFQTMSMNGIQGNLTFLVTAPIWLVVLLAMAGVLLHMTSAARVTRVPTGICVTMLVVPTLFLGIPLMQVPWSDRVDMEIGSFVAFFGLALGYGMFLSSSRLPRV